MSKKSFTLDGEIKKAELKVTALGLYFAEINGKRVGDCYLTPGWTSYQKTLQMQSYDIAEMLKGVKAEIVLPNENSIVCNGGKYTYERNMKKKIYKPFTPESDVDEVFNNPVALGIFNDVFDGLFSNNRIPSWIRSNRSLKFIAEYMADRKEINLKEFSSKLELANKKFIEKTTDNVR